MADRFERYSERARRAVVIARIEACQLCAPSIDTEHLLLGAANADLDGLNRFLTFEVSEQSLRDQILANATKRENVPRELLSIPFTDKSTQAFSFAEEEANLRGHECIGIEHLILGLLCVVGSTAARMLGECGVEVERIRDELAKVPHQPLPRNEKMHQDIERINEIFRAFFNPVPGQTGAQKQG